jgi:hypothetical protein
VHQVPAVNWSAFVVGGGLGLLGYLVGRTIERLLSPKASIINHALAEYIRNHPPK